MIWGCFSSKGQLNFMKYHEGDFKEYADNRNNNL